MGASRRLWNWSLGFCSVWVVHLGARFGLFRKLQDRRSPIPPEKLASGLSLNGAAVDLWCQAAHSIGLLRKRDGGYLLPETLKPLLADPADPRYMAGQHSYLALRSMDYDGFDGFFRRGIITGFGAPHLVEAFTHATEWDHTAFLKVFLPKVPEIAKKLSSGASVVDVGCGTGSWIKRVGSTFPKSSFLGIEPDAATLRQARRYKRAEWRLGRAEDLPFVDRFDLVHLGEVLYAVGDKPRVLRNCRRALKPGGHLVIAEGLLEGNRRPHDPVAQLLRCMGLDFALQGSGFLAKEELRLLLQSSEFGKIRFVSAGGGFWFVAAARDS